MLYREFQQVAARFPDKPAVIVGAESLTYRELDAQILRFAAQLRAHGIGPGDTVMILLANGTPFVVGVFGVLALGAVALPVNTRFPADEIKYYLETSAAKAVVHEDNLADLLASIAPTVTRLAWSSFADSRADAPISMPADAGPGADTPALYMYSSGSTGKPKRVTRTHGQIAVERGALASTLGITADDRILCTVPLYHSHGFCNGMLAALLNGGTLVIVPGEFSPRDAMRAIERERITIYPAVPFMFKMIGEAFFKNKPDVSSLRLAFSAGAALPAAAFERFRDVFGVPVRQLYGSTETGAVAINVDGAPGTESSVGRPLDGYRIDILDESGVPLPHGETGMIAIRSPAQTLCYDNLPEITAECFVGDYFLPGDLAAKGEDGNITIKGRKKLLINVAGYKVDPIDVETVIGAHPKVKDVVVLGVEEANAGEMVKAVVVTNAACSADEIIQHCARQLAPYKVPKLVEFRTEIPRSPLGKILRKYLQTTQESRL